MYFVMAARPSGSVPGGTGQQSAAGVGPTRRRNRRQDVYDLALLLHGAHPLDEAERARLLDCLVVSARARDIDPHNQSMRDPAVRAMAAEGYGTLQPEIEGALPQFEPAKWLTNFLLSAWEKRNTASRS